MAVDGLTGVDVLLDLHRAARAAAEGPEDLMLEKVEALPIDKVVRRDQRHRECARGGLHARVFQGFFPELGKLLTSFPVFLMLVAFAVLEPSLVCRG